jgi:hypothetical protein
MQHSELNKTPTFNVYYALQNGGLTPHTHVIDYSVPKTCLSMCNHPAVTEIIIFPLKSY